MTGPRLTVRTVCGLILIGLCIAVVVAVCWACDQWSPR